MDPIKSGAIFKLKSPSTTPTHPPPHPSPVNGISRSSAWTQWSPQPVASPHIQRFCYSHAMASIQTPPQSSPQKFDFNGAPQSAPSSAASSIKNSMLKHSFDRIYRATPLPPNIDRELFRLPVQPQSSSAAISAPTSQGMTAEYSPPRFYSSAQHSANEREHTNNKLDTVQHHEQHHALPTAPTFPNNSVHPSDPSIKSAYPPVIPLPAHVQRSQTHGNLSKSGQFGHSIPFGSPSHSSHINRILPGSSHVIVESSINHQASLPERSTAKNHLPLWNTEASSDPPIKSTNLEKEPSQSFQPQPIAPIVTVRYGGMNLSSDVHDLYEIDDTCKRTSTFDDVSDTKNRETDVPTVKKSPLHNQIDDIKPLFDSEDGDNMAGVDGSGYDDYQQHIMDDIDDQRIDSEWEVVEDKAMISNSVNSENKERQSTEKSERNPIISNNYGDEPEETVVKSPAYSVQNNDQNISASKDSSKDVLRSFFVDVDEETVPSSSVIPRKQHIISPREDSKCEAVVIGIVAEPPPDNSIVSVTVNSTTTTRSTAPSAGSRGRGMGRGMATDSLLAFIHQPIVGSLPSTSNTASGAGRGFSATKRPNLVNQSEMHSRDTSSSLLSNQRQESIAHSSVQDSFISSSTGRSLKSPLMSVERSIPANDMPAMNKSALTVSKINATKVNDKHNEIIDKPTNIPGNLKQAPSQTRVNKPVDTETGLFRLNDNATVKAKNKTKPPKIKRALDSQSDDNSAIDDSDYNSEEKLSPVAQKRGRGRPKKIRLDTTDASFNASVAYKHTKTGRWTKPISKLLDEVQGVDGSSTNAVSVIKTSIANVKPNQNETVVASSSSSATSLPITSSSSITMISRKLLEQLNGEDDNSTKRKGSQAKSGTVREWQAQESVALYSVHAKTDATNPNFWGLISEQLKQRGFHRSPEECEQRWYAVSFVHSTIKGAHDYLTRLCTILRNAVKRSNKGKKLLKSLWPWRKYKK